MTTSRRSGGAGASVDHVLKGRGVGERSGDARRGELLRRHVYHSQAPIVHNRPREAARHERLLERVEPLLADVRLLPAHRVNNVVGELVQHATVGAADAEPRLDGRSLRPNQRLQRRDHHGRSAHRARQRVQEEAERLARARRSQVDGVAAQQLRRHAGAGVSQRAPWRRPPHARASAPAPRAQRHAGSARLRARRPAGGCRLHAPCLAQRGSRTGQASRVGKRARAAGPARQRARVDGTERSATPGEGRCVSVLAIQLGELTWSRSVTSKGTQVNNHYVKYLNN
eukprot:scaffold107428_cov36-Phaeocystis_antarctica.AAC.1